MTTMEHSENVLADTLVNRQNAGKRGPAVGRFLTDPGFFAPGLKDHSAVRRIAAAHDVRVDALDQADEKVLELRTLLESPVPERPSSRPRTSRRPLQAGRRQRTIDAETRVIASELLVEAEAIANAAIRTDLLPAAIETLCGRFDDALGDVVEEAVDNVPDVPTSELGRLSVRQFELHGQLQRAVGMLEMLVEHRKELASFIGEPVAGRTRGIAQVGQRSRSGCSASRHPRKCRRNWGRRLRSGVP